MDHGHPGRSAHKNQTCKITPFDLRFVEYQFDGHQRAFHQVFGEFFEFFPIEFRPNPFSLVTERDRDRLTLGQCMLGLICFPLQQLLCDGIIA